MFKTISIVLIAGSFAPLAPARRANKFHTNVQRPPTLTNPTRQVQKPHAAHTVEAVLSKQSQLSAPVVTSVPAAQNMERDIERGDVMLQRLDLTIDGLTWKKPADESKKSKKSDPSSNQKNASSKQGSATTSGNVKTETVAKHVAKQLGDLGLELVLNSASGTELPNKVSEDRRLPTAIGSRNCETCVGKNCEVLFGDIDKQNKQVRSKLANATLTKFVEETVSSEKKDGCNCADNEYECLLKATCCLCEQAGKAAEFTHNKCLKFQDGKEEYWRTEPMAIKLSTTVENKLVFSTNNSKTWEAAKIGQLNVDKIFIHFSGEQHLIYQNAERQNASSKIEESLAVPADSSIYQVTLEVGVAPKSVYGHCLNTCGIACTDATTAACKCDDICCRFNCLENTRDAICCPARTVLGSAHGCVVGGQKNAEGAWGRTRPCGCLPLEKTRKNRFSENKRRMLALLTVAAIGSAGAVVGPVAGQKALRGAGNAAGGIKNAAVKGHAKYKEVLGRDCPTLCKRAHLECQEEAIAFHRPTARSYRRCERNGECQKQISEAVSKGVTCRRRNLLSGQKAQNKFNQQRMKHAAKQNARSQKQRTRRY